MDSRSPLAQAYLARRRENGGINSQSASERRIPVRQIVRLPRGSDGLFVQPYTTGPQYELEENHRRLGFVEVFHYADQNTGNSRTFDPKGNYNCGACNKSYGDECLLVKPDDIDPKAGSCQHWENLCAGDPELENNVQPKSVAVYGVAKNGMGFGCHRCPFASKAFELDSRGRSLFCGKGAFRVPPEACCALNGAPTIA